MVSEEEKNVAICPIAVYWTLIYTDISNEMNITTNVLMLCFWNCISQKVKTVKCTHKNKEQLSSWPFHEWRGMSLGRRKMVNIGEFCFEILSSRILNVVYYLEKKIKPLHS